MLNRAIGFIAIFAAAVSATITSCGTSQSVFTIDSLSVMPETPIPGDVTTMSIGFDAPVSVSAGVATYTLTLNGLPFSQRQDLCAATMCPIAAGHNTIVSNLTIPSSVAGAIAAKIEWSDATGDELMCVRVKETLQSKALVVFPYSPQYLNSAVYVDMFESMQFFIDDYVPFVVKKTHLRGRSGTTVGQTRMNATRSNTALHVRHRSHEHVIGNFTW